MGIEGKLLVSRKNIVVNKESIGIDNDLTKDRNMNTFKRYCKWRESGARFPDRKANNRLCECHCIAGAAMLGLEVDGMDQAVAYWQIYMYTIVRPRDGMRACKNTVRCPDNCPFQVSSVMTFHKSSRRRPQSSRPSDTFACPA